MKSSRQVPQRLLVVRNDKLGDFMLAYPSFALLKQALPEAHIAALVPAYTREMAEVCPWIDEVIIDPGTARGGEAAALARLLRPHDFDVLLALFSTTRTALAGWLARIPYRLAPATKLAQLLYNHRLVQRRSRGDKPEFMYNLALAVRLLNDHGIEVTAFPRPPFLHFAEDETAALRAAFCTRHGIAAQQRLVFIHAGSGGSANNLSPAQYAELGRTLATQTDDITLVLTAGPGELDAAQAVAQPLGATPHVIFESTEGLARFARHIQFADLFISGSTGPLHIAGALNVPTAAFYPRRRSATALRWQTLNSPERRLAFSPPSQAEESDMGAVDVSAAARQIATHLLQQDARGNAAEEGLSAQD